MILEDVTRHIGRRLAQRRTELKLSLAEVSAHCGVSLQQIHRYEIGQNVISVSMLWSLGNCLGVPPGYFYAGLEGTAVETAPGASPEEHPAGLGSRTELGKQRLGRQPAEKPPAFGRPGANTAGR